MANTGLLVLTSPKKVTKLLPIIQKHVLKTLYIQYFPEKNIFLPNNHGSTNPLWRTSLIHTISNIYFDTSMISALDVRVLLSSIKNPNLSIIHTKKPVEVVIFDQTCGKKEADTFIHDRLANISKGCNFVTLDDQKDDQKDEKVNNGAPSMDEERMYKNVVVGGTFDRIHNGHKIFLSEAILRCTEKLTVGVTDTNMLSGKLLWEMIEPCTVRISNLNDFLEDVDSTLTYNVVPIHDMYGPTKEDPSFEMIVVSEETKRGGDKVNEMRTKNNLSKLDVHVVNLVIDKNSKEHEEHKISSSNQRIRLLGTRLRAPRLGDKPLKPYIIGLTGGIASGKSSVASKLQKLGAALVNCDKIAHDLYLPGKECFDAIVEGFGPTILGSDGFINRKALGNIVFNDKAQLDKLNKIVWPIILKEAKNQINDFHTNGFDIIVMEAAVLIQAKWQNECHEIWTCIIPQAEAIRRVVERNGLTENDAMLRVQVQPSNTEQVNEANIVICSLWSHDVTEQQVQKAWDELSTFLFQKTKS